MKPTGYPFRHDKHVMVVLLFSIRRCQFEELPSTPCTKYAQFGVMPVNVGSAEWNADKMRSACGEHLTHAVGVVARRSKVVPKHG
jgi:hypothetical protein